MDKALIERWLGDGERVSMLDEASISVARDAVRALGLGLGLSSETMGRLALVVSELASNQLRHARDGAVAFASIERDGVLGIEVTAADAGDGIQDAGAALDGGVATSTGLGIGLSSVQRLSDEVDFDVRLGLGTCIRARVFGASVRRRREVSILGRNCEGERTSGDDATFARTGDALVLALADGLGHGPEARVAGVRAIECVLAAPSAPPAESLRLADLALRDTRGAVMSVVVLDERAGTFSHAGVGNVVTKIALDGRTRSLTGSSFVIGAKASAPPRVQRDEGTLVARELVVLYSDGLRSRLDVEVIREVANRHPLVIAHRLLTSFGRDNDDATVIVAS